MDVAEMLAREEIRQRMADYHMAGDRADAAGFAAVFARDGVLEGEGFTIEGRDAIEAWMRDPTMFSSEGRRPRFVRHHLTTTSIALVGNEVADVRAYWLVMTDIGVDHCGYYVDRFIREQGRWLIGRRRARTIWRAPDSYLPASA